MPPSEHQHNHFPHHLWTSVSIITPHSLLFGSFWVWPISQAVLGWERLEGTWVGATNRSTSRACRHWPGSRVSPQQERWCLLKSKLAANPEAIKTSGHEGYGWRALSEPSEPFLLGLPCWDKLEWLFQGRKYASQQEEPLESKCLWQGSLSPCVEKKWFGLEFWRCGGSVNCWGYKFSKNRFIWRLNRKARWSHAVRNRGRCLKWSSLSAVAILVVCVRSISKWYAT